ncbi:hypothetical protein [Arthrobacter sp. NicSoilB11]|uniref:AbiTii domain-containing protein n=1 Tax=Arthrobacter sp. NicSoilB11 TaxID=2830999 RepID=UPI001CC4F27F|nr:hypothetical protein [Arthrobacter sp. NicSoilB11]BCW75445.1 hypothetical protein NicSoilB11_17700 [Arthrobacter sp. NicSoilB11]
MTLLDEIVDGSTDGSVSTANLLRKVQVAATRLGAKTIVDWVKSELSGYADGVAVPPYRHTETAVMGMFAGPMRSTINTHLSSAGLPSEIASWFSVELRQPLAELESLASGETDPGRSWPPHLVGAYEAAGVYRIEFHELFSAHNVLTRQYLHGIIDTVRNRAMEFALELQSEFPNAGSVGGPTLQNEPQLASVVYNITNNITGHGTNIGAGSNIHLRSTVKAGDRSSVEYAAKEIGLSPEDARTFADAIQTDGATEGPNVSGFLEKVRTGAINVASSVASDTAASALVEVAKAYLGLSG